VLAGGGDVSQQWADEIGAEGYAVTAGDGVRMAVKFASLKKQSPISLHMLNL